jgi:uncharacterized protein YndB with AHSA1/START domain
VGDYDILMQFDIPADRPTVLQALTTREGIAAWWSTKTELSDGRLQVGFPDVPEPFEFRVGRTDRERVEWVTGGFPPWWAGTTIRWDLSDWPEQPGTRLLFSHRGYEPDNPVIPIVTPAWAQIVLRLKAYAETGRPQPFFDF